MVAPATPSWVLTLLTIRGRAISALFVWRCRIYAERVAFGLSLRRSERAAASSTRSSAIIRTDFRASNTQLPQHETALQRQPPSFGPLSRAVRSLVTARVPIKGANLAKQGAVSRLGKYRFPSNINDLVFGWGGRVRTSAWWNQNPLPYHLATPQQHPAPKRPTRSERTIIKHLSAGNPQDAAICPSTHKNLKGRCRRARAGKFRSFHGLPGPAPSL